MFTHHLLLTALTLCLVSITAQADPPAPAPSTQKAGAAKPQKTRPSVEYYEEGHGPAVLLLHGGNCAADDWADIVPALARNYRLILPDGLVVPLDPWRVWLLLDHLGIEQVTLVGHSAGGQLARDMYRLQPKRVRALVSIDSTGVGQTILARNLPANKLSPEAAALLEKNRAAVAQLKPSHRGDYPSTVTIEHRLLGYRRAEMIPRDRAATRTWPAPRSYTIEDQATPKPEPIADTGKFITCPVLVFHTGRGKLGPEDISPEWIEKNMQAADVEYVVIRESGHWPWHENAEFFLSKLSPFLARTARTAGAGN